MGRGEPSAAWGRRSSGDRCVGAWEPQISQIGQILEPPQLEVTNCDFKFLLGDLRDTEPAADLPCQQIGDLGMTGDRFHRSVHGIGPEGVRAAFSLENTAVATEVLKEGVPLHVA